MDLGNYDKDNFGPFSNWPPVILNKILDYLAERILEGDISEADFKELNKCFRDGSDKDRLMLNENRQVKMLKVLSQDWHNLYRLIEIDFSFYILIVNRKNLIDRLPYRILDLDQYPTNQQKLEAYSLERQLGNLEIRMSHDYLTSNWSHSLLGAPDKKINLHNPTELGILVDDHFSNEVCCSNQKPSNLALFNLIDQRQVTIEKDLQTAAEVLPYQWDAMGGWEQSSFSGGCNYHLDYQCFPTLDPNFQYLFQTGTPNLSSTDTKCQKLVAQSCVNEEGDYFNLLQRLECQINERCGTTNEDYI